MYLNEPYLFDDTQAQKVGYPEDLLPEMLWGAAPSELHNAHESEVFNYLWEEVFDREKVAEIVAERRPYVDYGDMFFVATERLNIQNH